MASYAPVSQKIEGWISVLYIRLFRITPLSTYDMWLWLSSVDPPHISKTADCRPLGVFSSRWKECRLNFRLNDRLQWLAFHHPNYYSLFLTHNFAQITRNYTSVHLTIACSRHSVFWGRMKKMGERGKYDRGTKQTLLHRSTTILAHPRALPLPFFHRLRALYNLISQIRKEWDPRFTRPPFHRFNCHK